MKNIPGFDDFTFMKGDQELKIGKYVHITSFVSIIEGSKLYIGDYVMLACGARIITGTESFHNGKHISSALPLDERNVIIGNIIIERDAFIGTNVIVHPNVTIGEGAVIGSGSLVLKSVEPWSINVGSPSKKVGDRPPINDRMNN